MQGATCQRESNMSISGVSSNSLFSLADLSGASGVDQTSATVSFSDFPTPPPRHHGGGGDFIGAIKEALASLEADTATSSTVSTSSTDGTTSTQNVDAALNSFLQNLLTALHSESTLNSTTDSSTDNDSVTSASAVAAATASSAATAANRPPPPGGRLEGDLTKLVQSLSASESSTSSTNTNLESSFADLLSALGDSGGTSLSSFLQSITSKLHATPPSGNIINTTA